MNLEMLSQTAIKCFLLEENWSRLWASSIVDQLVKHGVKDFYVSPGMRNAPFLATLAHRKKQLGDVNYFVGVDERAHAYRALGAAKSAGRPVVLMCTSGTAAVNYLPALTEAFHTSVPLIVVSADRPIEAVLQQDNQTIAQENIFEHVVVWKCSLPTPSQAQHFHLLSQLMAQAIHNAKTQQRSIHLNVPLDVPLEPPPSDTTVSLVPADVLQLARQLADGHFPLHQRHRATEDYSQLTSQISNNLIKAKNPLIVFGELPLHWGEDFATQQMLMESLLAQLKSRQVTFFADAGSSFKYQLPLVARALPCPDHPEALELWKTQNFDFILHIGGRTISKNYYHFIQQLPAATNLMALSIRDEIEDPSGRFSQRASINLFQFFHVWLEKLKLLTETNRQTENSLLPLWLQLENNKRAIIDSAPLSYPQVSKTLIECLPDRTVLFLGNSTVPRTFDSYIHGHQERQISIVTQRGVSGIEGNLSTTMGLRDNLPQEIPVAAVIGDIAMIHDLNALLELSHSTQPLVLFIVNNFGGGIFNLLPVARETEIMHLLTTPHQWQFAPIARAMNLHSIQVTTKEELLKATKLAFELNRPCLIEILINDQQNQEVYKKLRTVRL